MLFTGDYGYQRFQFSHLFQLNSLTLDNNKKAIN